jgi:hypothetical protein
MATTDYLQGSGSSIDPYIIHSIAAAVQWFGTDIFTTPKLYAELVTDVDLTGYTFSSTAITYGQLQGNGHTITALKHFAGGAHHCVFFRCKFISINTQNTYPFQSPSAANFTDCAFWGGTFGCWSATEVFILARCIFSGVTWKNTKTTGVTVTNCFILPPSGYSIPPQFTNLSSSDSAYEASNYASFDSENWEIDGTSAPRLKQQNTAALTQAYVVEGTTQVGGVAKSRTVSVHSPLDLHQFASIKSDADDGSYLLNCGYYTDHVAVVHRDDYGKLLVASKAYALGERIHPATPNGYAYECTKAGTSSATEPTNWPTAGTLTSGSAIFTAQPVYKPETFIAVPVLFDLVTGLPV